MRIIATSVRDLKAGTSDFPYGSPNEAVAVRRFADGVNTPGTVMNKHPEDFQLFHVGFFSDDDMELEKCKPAHLADATSLKETDNE